MSNDELRARIQEVRATHAENERKVIEAERAYKEAYGARQLSGTELRNFQHALTVVRGEAA